MSQFLSQADNEIETKPLLAATIHDVRYFAALLRGINFVNRATLLLTAEGGMTITVEESHTLLATSYVFPDHFDEWKFDTDVCIAQSSQSSELEGGPVAVTIDIPISTVVDCLNIFGTANILSGSGPKHRKWRHADDLDLEHEAEDDQNRQRSRAQLAPPHNRIEQYFQGSDKRTSMRLTYAGGGHPLTLLIAEDSSGPTTTCEITTFAPEPNLELPFDPDRTLLKIIFKSSAWLRDALSELDPSCERVTFIGNPPPGPGKLPRGALLKPMFRIQASGTFGSAEMDYPNDREVLETFECIRAVRFSYHFSHISRTIRALQSSTKTSLRIDDEGLLSLQFLVPVPKPRGGMSDSFIEFRCLALDDET